MDEYKKQIEEAIEKVEKEMQSTFRRENEASDEDTV